MLDPELLNYTISHFPTHPLYACPHCFRTIRNNYFQYHPFPCVAWLLKRNRKANYRTGSSRPNFAADTTPLPRGSTGLTQEKEPGYTTLSPHLHLDFRRHCQKRHQRDYKRLDLSSFFFSTVRPFSEENSSRSAFRIANYHMTESRAFATMVTSPSQKGSLTSAPATSNPSFPFSSSSSSSSSLSSHSTLKQLWSYIPFLSASPSSPSSPLPLGRSTHIRSISDTASSHPSCSTRTCLSYCCITPDLTAPCPQSRPTPTFNLRPKNYFSKRQRFMSSSPRQSSASSASHSESGSDRDEQNDSTIQRHLHVRRRSSPDTNSTATITTTTTTTTTTASLAKSGPLTVSSVEAAMTIPGNKTRLPALGLVANGPYLFVFDVALSLHYPIRAMILFVLGFVFSMVIDHLQTQHQLVEYPDNTSHFWDTASWLPPTCGVSAVLIGTVYPLGDYLWWGKPVRRNDRDWSSVMRCLGGFIGVNYAASKLPWTSSLQVSSTLALISVALWFLFDRTFHGFVISLTVASMGTIVAYFLVLNGWYSFTRADFFGVGSWIPCILYSSSVCFGSIGRQLDVVPEAWYHSNGTGHVHLKSK